MNQSVLYYNFNEDGTCFCVGTDKGFQIWNLSPCKIRYAKDLGGIGIVEMVERSNILALVGGGNNPAYPKNKVMIWDDNMGKVLAELEFRSQVSLVRISRTRIMVATWNKIYVYRFSDLSLLYSGEIQDGTGHITSYVDKILAYPALGDGQVQIHFEQSKFNKTPFQAHEHKISNLCLNREATLLATASSQGTVIKIFNLGERKLLTKLRRSKDPAKITHMSFSPNSEWLCVCSDKGTAHIFSILDDTKAQKSSINFIGDIAILPSGLHDYVNSDFSFAQIHYLPPDSKVTFDTQVSNQLHVLSSDGHLTLYSFDTKRGGEARRELSYIYKQGD